jgi:hypothetical protein
MKKMMVFLLWCLVGCVYANVDPCEGLSSIDKLACQKSYHKQIKKQERANRANAADQVLRSSPELIDKSAKKNLKKQSVAKPKPRLPHNRKASRDPLVKRNTVENKNRGIDKAPSTTKAQKAGWGLSATTPELLVSDSDLNESEAVSVLSSEAPMLSSQSAYVLDVASPVGEDALYQIY